MTDSRFETPAADVDELVELIDLDDLDQAEMLLTLTFSRPVQLIEWIDENDGTTGFEVIVSDGVTGVGLDHAFPTTAVSLTRAVLEVVTDLDFCEAEEHGTAFPKAASHVTDEELIDTLRRRLGELRVLQLAGGI